MSTSSNRSIQRGGVLSRLPPEMNYRTLSYLSHADLARATSTSHLGRGFYNQPSIDVSQSGNPLVQLMKRDKDAARESSYNFRNLKRLLRDLTETRPSRYDLMTLFDIFRDAIHYGVQVRYDCMSFEDIVIGFLNVVDSRAFRRHRPDHNILRGSVLKYIQNNYEPVPGDEPMEGSALYSILNEDLDESDEEEEDE